MKKLAVVCMVLFGLTLYRSESQIVTTELKSFEIYESSMTLVWKETTSPFENQPETFRVYKHDYSITGGIITFDGETEGTYVPGTATDEVITFP